MLHSRETGAMSFLKRSICCALCVFGLTLAAPCASDDIELKNGVRLSGRLDSKDDDGVMFIIAYDTIRVPARIAHDDIKIIELDNYDRISEQELFSIQQQAKGLLLHEGRWLPQAHVNELQNKRQKIDRAKQITLFSLQFFLFLMFCLIMVIIVDFIHYEWKRFRVRRAAKSTGADHRLHRRIPISVPFTYCLDDGEEQHTNTSNISLGGLLFSTAAELPLTTQMTVSIGADDNHIECRSMVVRCEKDSKEKLFNIGLSFIGLSSEMRHKLARLISEANK